MTRPDGRVRVFLTVPLEYQVPRQGTQEIEVVLPKDGRVSHFPTAREKILQWSAQRVEGQDKYRKLGHVGVSFLCDGKDAGQVRCGRWNLHEVEGVVSVRVIGQQ